MNEICTVFWYICRYLYDLCLKLNLIGYFVWLDSTRPWLESQSMETSMRPCSIFIKASLRHDTLRKSVAVDSSNSVISLWGVTDQPTYIPSFHSRDTCAHASSSTSQRYVSLYSIYFLLRQLSPRKWRHKRGNYPPSQCQLWASDKNSNFIRLGRTYVCRTRRAYI